MSCIRPCFFFSLLPRCSGLAHFPQRVYTGLAKPYFLLMKFLFYSGCPRRVGIQYQLLLNSHFSFLPLCCGSTNESSSP